MEDSNLTNIEITDIILSYSDCKERMKKLIEHQDKLDAENLYLIIDRAR